MLGNLDRRWGRRSLVAEDLRWGKKPHPTDLAAVAGVSENTTLTWLVTNRKLIRGRNCNAWRSLRPHRWHERSSPWHTETDEDTFFAVAKAEASTSDPHSSELWVLSAELAWDAVLNCAPKPFAEVAG